MFKHLLETITRHIELRSTIISTLSLYINICKTRLTSSLSYPSGRIACNCKERNREVNNHTKVKNLTILNDD
jgi:hypothetical protein